MREISFTVEGKPKPQPRPRAYSRTGITRMYDPRTAEGWKQSISEAARDHIPAEPMEGALSLWLEFIMPRPKAHYLKSGLRVNAPYWHTIKPDTDNLCKAVMDCMTSMRFWNDDSQVCELKCRKLYERDQRVAGLFVNLHQSGEGLTLKETETNNDRISR